MKLKIYAMVLLLSGVISGTANAQLAPLGAMYFQNQYLNNPAFAGKESGLELDLSYRQQWSSLPGSPKIQALTASYAMTSKAGLGLNLFNDQAGLFQRTRLVGSYAYHLPLNANDHKLSFGISFGFMDETVDYNRMDGDIDDISVGNFNQRKQYLDGDFGVAYSTGKLQLQASLPNLRNSLGFNKEERQVVDDARFYVGASYKWQLSEGSGIEVEPKLAFRGIRGFTNIVDFGSNFTFAEGKIGLMAMYHSSESASFGFSTRLSRAFHLMGFYTTNTAALARHANGSFELNLKMNLFDKQ